MSVRDHYETLVEAVVTGAAGFLGSHLVDSMVADGWRVWGIDNLSTGRRANLEAALRKKRFRLRSADITGTGRLPRANRYYHLASPASPPAYQHDPISTLRVNSAGTLRVLEAARRSDARVLLASTSEVYGDPEVNPQSESYWGHVNPIGPRSCYDEGKRYAEALAMAYRREHGLDIRIARIFNTYGPGWTRTMDGWSRTSSCKGSEEDLSPSTAGERRLVRFAMFPTWSEGYEC